MDVSTSEFILEHVKRRQSEEPVIVGLQGPQGSGEFPNMCGSGMQVLSK